MNPLMKMLLMLGVVFLTACGGGSDNNPEPQPQPEPEPEPGSGAETGVFLDSPVSNIGYRTDTLEGVTNAAGEYEYEPGETVTFFIGDLEFPAVPASGVVTPLDIAGTTDTSDNTVINIARLLQTLDTDGNPDNGITISDDAASVASAPTGSVEEFFSQPVEDFAADATVTNFVFNAGQDTPPTELVSVEDTKAHLESSLEEEEVPFTNEISLTGGWVMDTSNGAGNLVFLAFDEDTGNYFHVEAKEFEEEEEEGLEYGAFSLDADNVLNVTSNTFDQNGGIGLHDPEGGVGSGDADEYLTFTADGSAGELGVWDAFTAELLETLPAGRVVANGLEGTWVYDDPDDEYGLLVFVFMADGKYIHAELKHERDYTDEWDGAEYGSYSYEGSLTEGDLTAVTAELNTNGTAGIDLVDDISVAYEVSGNKLYFTLTELVTAEIEVMSFTRLGAGENL